MSVSHPSVCVLWLCQEDLNCSFFVTKLGVLVNHQELNCKTKTKKVEGCHLLLQEVRVLEVEKDLQLVQQERDVLLQQVDILKM